MQTPWRVVVDDGRRQWTTRDVVPSLNPDEFGVEIVRILRFNMHEYDILLDGEILERGPHLARRPVGMFSLEALRKMFQQGSGRPMTVASRERRKLPAMESHEWVVFDHDLELRRRRLRDPHVGSEEVSYLHQWESAYGPAFADQDRTSPPVPYLCPATWKTLDAAFARGVLS